MPEIRFQPTAQRGLSPGGRIGFVLFIVVVLVIVFQFNSIRRYVSGFFVKSWEEQLMEVMNNPNDDRIVVDVAARDIPAFTRIELSMLRKDIKNKQAILSAGKLTDIRQIVDRVTIMDVPAGTVFSEGLLAPPKTREGIAAGIQPGWGAISLPEKRIDGQISNLKINDRVAILATIEGGSDRNSPSALVGNVAVVSKMAKVLKPLEGRSKPKKPPRSPLEQMIDSRAGHESPEDEDRREITLQMPSEDLVRLAQVGDTARLQLLLMSSSPDGSELDLNIPEMEQPQPEVIPTPSGSTAVLSRPGWTVEVIRGSKRSQHEINPN